MAWPEYPSNNLDALSSSQGFSLIDIKLDLENSITSGSVNVSASSRTQAPHPSE